VVDLARKCHLRWDRLSLAVTRYDETRVRKDARENGPESVKLSPDEERGDRYERCQFLLQTMRKNDTSHSQGARKIHPPDLYDLPFISAPFELIQNAGVPGARLD
jgi:hypothetical protein